MVRPPAPKSREEDEVWLEMIQLSEEGWTAQAIADRFGYGRNQVIGILHRLKTAMKEDR